VLHVPSLRNKDQVKEACLEAARDAIIDLGWRRTTITEVARRAGVSRMTIYRSWSDMGQLFADVLVREWAGVVRAEATAGTSTREALVAAIVAVTRQMRHDALFQRVIELDPELILPYLLQRRGLEQERIITGYVRAIKTGQKAGEIRDGDPATMARALLLTGTGFLLSIRVVADDGVSEEALDAEFAHILDRTLAP
jgi:AcrR family transcriptional regulator